MQIFKKKPSFVNDELTISTTVKLLPKGLPIKASKLFVQLNHLLRDARKVNRSLLDPSFTQEVITSF